MDALKWIEFAITAAAGLAIGVTAFRGNLSNDTIKLMKENKEAQENAVQRLRDELTMHESQAKIRDEKVAHLNGQVQMLKDIPLTQIAKSLEVVSRTHADMQQFLKDHQTQAAILANQIADKVIQSLKDKQ